MSLTGQGIRLIVNEPFDTSKNLFGRIIKQHGNTLLIRLSKTIQGNLFSSDLMELKPLSQDETFKPLEQYYSVTVQGFLVHHEIKESENILTGTVTMD